MPYTPIDRTSRAWASESLSWQNVPPYATFRVPYAFTAIDAGTVPDAVARGVYNGMIDPSLGTWSNGAFTPARPGRHRFAAQFLTYKQQDQGQISDTFLRLELVRDGLTTTLSVCDSLQHLVTDGELVMPLKVEATPHLLPGDQVQVRFGLIQGELISIVTGDPTRSFCDVTAYWS